MARSKPGRRRKRVLNGALALGFSAVSAGVSALVKRGSGGAGGATDGAGAGTGAGGV
jgi:hypothetical protein